MIKYPDIKVKLVGTNGNAFAVIGAVTSALKRAGVDRKEITEFQATAMASDYDNVLLTCMNWVNVE